VISEEIAVEQKKVASELSHGGDTLKQAFRENSIDNVSLTGGGEFESETLGDAAW
jgi:hypothetical protein